MSRWIVIAWGLLLLGVLAAGIAVLEVRRHALADEVADLRRRQEILVRQHADRERTRTDLASAAEETARQAAAVELVQARQEVAELEHHAVSRRAEMLAASARRKAADAAAVASDNRDPTKGMAKLEHFQNVGRETPEAALQTLVWAALKGEDAALAAGMALDDRARARAEVLLARLPENARAATTAEKLAALWFAQTVMEVPAAYIFDQEAQDGTHVTLLVRGGLGSDQRLPMQLGPSGWQVVVPEHAMESIQKSVIGSSPPLPKP